MITDGAIGSVPRCASCGSERVVQAAWACWNPEFGLWELETTRAAFHCHQCGGSEITWVTQDAPPNQRIRELNDCFRREGKGRGTVMLTVGVQAQGHAFIEAAVAAVQAFDDFNGDNDPWGEHDFGAVEIAGEKVFWKIDPYNLDQTAGSENPANEALTHRVLSIMLASEY